MDSIKTWLSEIRVEGDAFSKLCADLDDFGIKTPIDLIDLEEKDIKELGTTLRRVEVRRFHKAIAKLKLSADQQVPHNRREWFSPFWNLYHLFLNSQSKFSLCFEDAGYF